jgi:hypothetical protein
MALPSLRFSLEIEKPLFFQRFQPAAGKIFTFTEHAFRYRNSYSTRTRKNFVPGPRMFVE